jgi:hypothetical protein
MEFSHVNQIINNLIRLIKFYYVNIYYNLTKKLARVMNFLY